MRRTLATVVCFSLCLGPLPPKASASERGRVSGTIHRLASNNGAFEKSGESQWIVRTDDDRVVEVRDGSAYESGTRVRLSTRPGQAGRAIATSVRGTPQMAGSVSAVRLVPKRRLAIVPFEWGGALWSEQDVTDSQTTVDELTSWWSRMSVGRESLTVTTTSAFNGNRIFPGMGDCMYAPVMLEFAVKHLKRAKPGKSFDNVMVLFPGSAPPCGWQGLGELNGRATWVYANGGGPVWAHELGHNLGFSHANTCFSGQALTYLKNCTDVEYGDSVDIMGNRASDSLDSSYFAPEFLRKAKWLPDDRMATWTGEAATYTINRADRADLGITAVRIPATDPAAGDNSFWLQYNPSSSNYRTPKSNATKGGIVITMTPSPMFVKQRFGSDSSDVPTGVALADSYLCDLTPGEEPLDEDDPRLLPGTSFSDPRNRFTVTLDSADGTTAQVRIEPVAEPKVHPVVSLDASAVAGGARMIRVSINGPAAGRNEPLLYIVDTVEDPGKTCTADLFVPKCVLSGLTRDFPYTVRVVGANGPARSPPVLAPTVVIPSGPPGFDVTFESTSSSIVAKVNVDDGGSPPTTPLTLELPGRRPCVMSLSVETTCTFKDLRPRSEYVFTARGANAQGVREAVFVKYTAAAVPVAPKVSGKIRGEDLVFLATVAKVDANNATHVGSQCMVNGSFAGEALRPVDPATQAVDFILESVRGASVVCSFRSIAPELGEGRGFKMSGSTVVLASPVGSIRTRRILLKVSATSTRKGSVLVKWSTKGSSVESVISVSTSSSKRCVRASANSCVVRGLKSRSALKVTVRAENGYAGAYSENTVVVK